MVNLFCPNAVEQVIAPVDAFALNILIMKISPRNPKSIGSEIVLVLIQAPKKQSDKMSLLIYFYLQNQCQ